MEGRKCFCAFESANSLTKIPKISLGVCACPILLHRAYTSMIYLGNFPLHLLLRRRDWKSGIDDLTCSVGRVSFVENGKGSGLYISIVERTPDAARLRLHRS